MSEHKVRLAQAETALSAIIDGLRCCKADLQRKHLVMRAVQSQDTATELADEIGLLQSRQRILAEAQHQLSATVSATRAVVTAERNTRPGVVTRVVNAVKAVAS